MISERMLSSVVRYMNGHYLNMKPCRGHRLPKGVPGKRYMLYAHIPFCESLCPYCSFNRFPFKEDAAREYFDLLRKEMRMLGELGYSFESMYIGGGTPTVLPGELADTISLAKDLFGIRDVSAETNPNHLKPEYLDCLKGLVDRMSVGVQSFDDGLLKSMYRYHRYGSAESIKERLAYCADTGYFKTLNVDMIFNFPTQTEEMLLKDIEEVKKSGCNQTTFYPLMASPSVEKSLKDSVGEVNYVKEKRYYELISEGLAGGEAPEFEHSSAWTFSRRSDSMIDEYVVDYEEYPAIGSGGMSFLNREYFINTFSLDEYRKRISAGEMSTDGSVRFGKRDHMRYRFMMKLFGLRLDKIEWERDFGISVERGLPLEYLFFKLNRAFETDDMNEITLNSRGRYLMVAMMRQFFIGVNSVRDKAREKAGIRLRTQNGR